jgi:hypothetical protein
MKHLNILFALPLLLLAACAQLPEDARYKPSSCKSPRSLTLTKIEYKDDAHWTIWLNNKRLSPGKGSKWPEEILSLEVGPDVARLQWVDKCLNRITATKLHPGQIYDLGTGITLPYTNSSWFGGGGENSGLNK